MKGTTTLWGIAAICMWLFSIPLCILLAHDLVDAPPPSLATWKTVAEFLPVLPIVVGGIAAIAAARLRPRSALIAVGAKAVFWGSVIVVLVALPKAP